MFAGVDGCKGGWIVATGDGAGQDFLVQKVATFSDVLSLTRDCKAVSIDMPIGLPTGTESRACDTAARQLLGKLAPPSVKGVASRVFNVAPRAVMEAGHTDYKSFAELHKTVAGKGISRQAFAITPKIMEVDALMTPLLQQRVIETHPELCFARLAGQTLPSKHKPEGIGQRAELLFGAEAIFLLYLKELGIPKSMRDDVLDACVQIGAARHFASLPSPETPTERRLPQGEIPLDEKGLRKEIRF